MKNRYVSLIYGGVAAIISFVAIFFLCRDSFKLGMWSALILALLAAAIFCAGAYYNSYASLEIKRIAHKYRLTDDELAHITGLRAQNFPIYHNQLQLVLPKRYLPLVLRRLRQLERDRDYAERD